MTNHQIADCFDLYAKLLDLHGENSFKVKSYASAAFTIDKWASPLAQMEQSAIASIRGIGAAHAEKIYALLQSGTLAPLEELIQQTPPGILDIMQIKGLGPKKIAVLWKELQIESVGELQYACQENRLLGLKGFGEKTQLSILQQIQFIQQQQGWFLWAEAHQSALAIQPLLQASFPDATFLMSGAYRMQDPTLQQIDFVCDVTIASLKKWLNTFEALQIKEQEPVLWVQWPQQIPFQFHCCNKENLYTTLFKTSCGAAFLETFTERYTLPDTADSEVAIFEQHQVPYLAACLRTDPKRLGQSMPSLIQVSDIKGIIHSHSTWSDGAHTLEAMAEAAKAKGLEYLVISDHSQAAFYANGLSPERIKAQHEEIDRLNERLAPFKILKSIEVDILNDGQLDYDDEVLASLDLVIASVHSNLKMSEEKSMARLLAAIAHPRTTILGHLTGRLLLSRPGYPIAHKTIIDACAQHKVAIEINAHPRRLDIHWEWIPYALEKGVHLSINPDAHSIEGFDDIYYGVMAAQKGGLQANQNLSSYSLIALEAYLQSKK
ncbi:MAG: PHP domain-containing protein [Bacteroidota bacterium]